MKTTEQMITAEEVLNLGGEFGIDSIYLAENVYSESLREYAKEENRDGAWVIMRALQNVFEAGRIQGIRQERQRRSKEA